MEAITIVIRSGLGMQVESVCPYLKPGTPIAIGRGGAVISEVADGNAIEDKRKAAESAGGYIDSVERYMESADNLESVVAGLESALIGIDACATEGQNGSALQAMDALRRIREIAEAFLDNSGTRAEQAYPGAAAARRPVNPGEQSRPAQDHLRCGICRDQSHTGEACPWKYARGGLALVQAIDRNLCLTPWGNGQQTAQQQENEYWRNLNAARYEWLRSAALDTGSANVPMVRIGMGDPLQGVALDIALNEAMTNWPIQADDYYAHDAELLCAGVDVATDRFEQAVHGWDLPADESKPSIFDVITGTANLPPEAAQELPSRDEHAAQIERVAADLRDDQLRANRVTEALGILDRWVEKVEYTDGYVGVVEIEAVEIVADELRRLTGGEA